MSSEQLQRMSHESDKSGAATVVSYAQATIDWRWEAFIHRVRGKILSTAQHITTTTVTYDRVSLHSDSPPARRGGASSIIALLCGDEGGAAAGVAAAPPSAAAAAAEGVGAALEGRCWAWAAAANKPGSVRRGACDEVVLLLAVPGLGGGAPPPGLWSGMPGLCSGRPALPKNTLSKESMDERLY